MAIVLTAAGVRHGEKKADASGASFDIQQYPNVS